MRKLLDSKLFKTLVDIAFDLILIILFITGVQDIATTFQALGMTVVDAYSNAIGLVTWTSFSVIVLFTFFRFKK